jgi:hypothetical protein
LTQTPDEQPVDWIVKVDVVEAPSASATVSVTVEFPGVEGAVQVTWVDVAAVVGVPSTPPDALHVNVSALPCGSVALA